MLPLGLDVRLTKIELDGNYSYTLLTPNLPFLMTSNAVPLILGIQLQECHCDWATA